MEAEGVGSLPFYSDREDAVVAAAAAAAVVVVAAGTSRDDGAREDWLGQIVSFRRHRHCHFRRHRCRRRHPRARLWRRSKAIIRKYVSSRSYIVRVIPGLFCLFELFTSNYYTIKIIDFSQIQTRIVGAEGELADRLTTTSAQSKKLFCCAMSFFYYRSRW